MLVKRKTASVILNYNSFKDAVNCTENLREQSLSNQIIIIDNKSNPKEIVLLKQWFAGLRTSKAILEIEGLEGNINYQKEIDYAALEILLVLNNKNGGYATGNNIGLRIAEHLGADSALVINPDIEILDKNYIENLEKALFQDSKTAIAASQITNKNGTLENPLKLHQSFAIDFFWFIRLPFLKIKSLIRIKNRPQKKYDAINFTNKNMEFVQKVSGACFLIKMSFLKEIDFLDEGTFLYLEETILSSQIISLNRKILFLGNLNAVHHHDYVKKKISARNAIIGCESYLHYLKNHSHFNKIQKVLLRLSVMCQILVYRVILKFQKL